MQIHELPTGSVGATEYSPIDNGSGTRKITLATLGNYVLNTLTMSLGGVTQTVKAAIDAIATTIGSGTISNVGASITAAIGNTVLGTTASTLSGAIAEHEGDISSLSGNVDQLNSKLAVPSSAISDANNATDVGFYRIGSSTTNGPVSGGSYALFVYKWSNALCVQIAIAPNSNTQAMFVRSQMTNGWGTWYKVTMTAQT